MPEGTPFLIGRARPSITSLLIIFRGQLHRRARGSLIRRALEALPEAWAETRPPDYAPNFDWQKKALTLVLERLDVIETHPALKMAPEQHAARIENAGLLVAREAERAYQKASIEAALTACRLAGMIGTIQSKRDQRLWLICFPGIAVVLTFLASLAIWRQLPFGLPSRSAAQIMNDDRWDAGWDLLQAADLNGKQQVAFGFDLAKANQEEQAECATAAAKTQKDQRCTTTVPMKW